MIFTKNAAASIIDMLLLVPYILGLIFMLGLRILIDIPWLLGQFWDISKARRDGRQRETYW